MKVRVSDKGDGTEPASLVKRSSGEPAKPRASLRDTCCLGAQGVELRHGELTVRGLPPQVPLYPSALAGRLASGLWIK
jgi:hypothetical protein